MNKFLTTAMAAVTMAGAVASTATPAAAEEHWHGGGGGWRGGGWHDHDRGNATGAAIAGGIVGLALGAAISSNHHDSYYGGHRYYGGGYYGGGYYGGPYYGPGYYDDGGYAVCTSERRIWDPYIGRYIIRSYNYAC